MEPTKMRPFLALLICFSLTNIPSTTQNLLNLFPFLFPFQPQPYPYCTIYENSTASTPECALDVADLGYGNIVAGTSDRSSDLLPSWVNIELAKQGQAVQLKYYGATVFAYLYTGWFFVLNDQGARTLLLTGNSDTTDKAGKRFAATAAQFALWGRDIFGVPGNTDNIRTSILNVRTRHLAVVQKQLDAKAQYGDELGLDSAFQNYTLQYPSSWNAFAQDLEESDIPVQYRTFPASYTSTLPDAKAINQYLMTMVQWTLSAMIGGFPNASLVQTATPYEFKAHNHFWAVIGFMLGIDDDQNICLRPSLASQTQLYQDFFKQYIIPSLFQASNYSKILAEISGTSIFSAVIPVIGSYVLPLPDPYNTTVENLGVDFIMIRVLKDFVGINATHTIANAAPETVYFNQLYENTAVPASYSGNTFHATLTAAGNAALLAEGTKEFPGNYTTDCNIARTVFV